MDFLWLDAEHTGLTPRQVSSVVRQLGHQQTRVMVRVQNLDNDALLTYANMGVDEIVLPRVRTVEEVQRACSWLAYPPSGRRPRQVTAATEWGRSYENQPAVSIILETMDAVRALDQLVETGRVSTFWLGPKDLRDDFEYEGGHGDDFDRVLDQLISALRDSGVPFGWGVPEPTDVASVWHAGATRCALYWDVHLARHLLRSTGTGLELGPNPNLPVDQADLG